MKTLISKRLLAPSPSSNESQGSPPEVKKRRFMQSSTPPNTPPNLPIEVIRDTLKLSVQQEAALLTKFNELWERWWISSRVPTDCTEKWFIRIILADEYKDPLFLAVLADDSAYFLSHRHESDRLSAQWLLIAALAGSETIGKLLLKASECPLETANNDFCAVLFRSVVSSGNTSWINDLVQEFQQCNKNKPSGIGRYAPNIMEGQRIEALFVEKTGHENSIPSSPIQTNSYS